MVLLSFLLIALYIIYFVIKYGVPHSLSATYYSIAYKVAFSLVLAVSAGLVLPTLLSITPVKYQFLAFLAIAGIMFVAAAPDYRNDDLVDYVHTGSAIFSLIISQILVFLISPYILMLWIPLILYIIILWINTKSLNKVFSDYPIQFWGEIIMLLTIYYISL